MSSIRHRRIKLGVMFMAKALKTVAAIAGVAALAVVTGGAAEGRMPNRLI
jgi:hypothetical protein